MTIRNLINNSQSTYLGSKKLTSAMTLLPWEYDRVDRQQAGTPRKI